PAHHLHAFHRPPPTTRPLTNRTKSHEGDARMLCGTGRVRGSPHVVLTRTHRPGAACGYPLFSVLVRSEEHTSELQSRGHLVCRLLLEKKKTCERARYLLSTGDKQPLIA